MIHPAVGNRDHEGGKRRMTGTLFLSAVLHLYSHGQWLQTNGPYGGSVQSFVASETHLFSGTNRGLFRSGNNGTDWTPVVELSSRNIVAMTTTQNEILAGTEVGIFRSADGEHWFPGGLFKLNVLSFAVLDSLLIAGTADGVFRSTNLGLEWTNASVGLPPSSGVMSLIVFQTHVYAGTWNGVFRSTDGGLNWAPVNSGLTNLYISSLVKNDDRLFAGTANGLFTLAGDDSWVFLEFPDMHVFSLAAGQTGIYAGTSNGLFRSTDNGTMWFSSDNGLPSTAIVAIWISESALHAGTRGDGVYRSMDGGNSWTKSSTGIIASTVSAFIGSGNELFAGIAGGGVSSTTDHGATWVPLNDGLRDSRVLTLAGDATNLFAGTLGGGIFRSTNGGKRWSQENQGLHNSFVTSLLISGDYFAGTYGGGVFRSSTAGVEWIPANAGLSNPLITSLATNGSDLYSGADYPATIFRSTDHGDTWNEVVVLDAWYVSALLMEGMSLFVGTDRGIFRSTDGFATWTQVYTGSNISCFEIQEGTIVAGTESGVIRSSDAGETWTVLNLGLPDLPVTTLRFHNDFLFAGTEAGGVWKRPVEEIVTEVRNPPDKMTPQAFSLDQNYPNPFNPSTMITFSLRERALVTLTIYDILGKRIDVPLSGEFPPGLHSVPWDASAYPGGIYFYKLESNGSAAIRKMILIK